MLDLQIKTKDLSKATRAVMELPGLFARARESALRSTGYHVQQDLRREGRHIEPKLNPHTGIIAQTYNRSGHRQHVGYKGRHGNKGVRWYKAGRSGGKIGIGGQVGHVKRRTSTRRDPFSRFVNMVRYEVDVEDNLVEIGVLNPRPQYFMWFRMNVAGFDTPVSPKLRKFFFGIGFPLRKETTVLHTPPRPSWIDSVREKWNRQGAAFFEMQLWTAMTRYRNGGLKD